MLRSAAVGVLWSVIAAMPAAAQIAPPGPPGPYVIDVRGATSPVPIDGAYFPPVPTGTRLPSRGYGVDVGAHVYALRLGPSRLGVGVSVLRVGGSASPLRPSSTSAGAASPEVATTPVVNATLTIIAPQLSFNFGSRAGWSYLSAGVGRARVRSATSAFAGAGAGITTAPAEANSGPRQSVNIGAGARWFAKTRLGVSFDLRAHIISAGAAEGTGVAISQDTVMAASVGISVR